MDSCMKRCTLTVFIVRIENNSYPWIAKLPRQSLHNFFPSKSENYKYAFKLRSKDMERTLVLPDSGSLRIEIRDASGALAPYDGSASLKFPGTRIASDWTAYE